MVKYRVVVIPGDGIGPEQTEAALEVLNAVQDVTDVKFDFVFAEAGDECLKRRGVPLPEDTVDQIRKSDACLKAPVGESAADVIVKLRQMFDLYANLRPAKSYPNVPALRPDVDLLIVRENTEDLYKGFEFYVNPDTTVALRVITRKGCERIAEMAFKLALKRRKKVTAVHKANVLRLSDGLFRQVCQEVASKYPDVKFEELYVDAAAMQLIKRPHEFDVMVMPNMFGDILSDEAAQVVGSLGIAPGANVGDRYGIFEPIHGSAPKLAGKGVANPISLILASKMMLEWLNQKQAADLVENAVVAVLSEGKTLTPDLGGSAKTMEVAKAIAEKVKALSSHRA